MSENESEAAKLTEHLKHREKKLQEMSILLADTNSGLIEALTIHDKLSKKKRELLHKLETKTKQLDQEQIDNKIIQKKLHDIEQSNKTLKNHIKG